MYNYSNRWSSNKQYNQHTPHDTFYRTFPNILEFTQCHLTWLLPPIKALHFNKCKKKKKKTKKVKLSRIPKDVSVTAIQWGILYFLVGHMTINKTRLNDFAEGQTRWKYPPFTFIPALAHSVAQRYTESCQIVTVNKSVASIFIICQNYGKMVKATYILKFQDWKL